MNTTFNPIKNRNILAWLLLTTTLAFHVLDEALSDFLSFYNPSVNTLNQQLGFFPAPTFNYSTWLAGLIIAIILCYLFTFLVARGGNIIRIITIIFGLLMVLNGLGHLIGSLYFREIIPGMWSSPFLLVAASFVIFQGLRGKW